MLEDLSIRGVGGGEKQQLEPLVSEKQKQES